MSHPLSQNILPFTCHQTQASQTQVSQTQVSKTQSSIDRPRYLRTRSRINRLMNEYLSVEQLSDRLSDLPSQFETPHQRHWEPICWEQINRSQIVDVDPELFLKVVASAAEIETPIREYSKESWDYFSDGKFHGWNIRAGWHHPDNWHLGKRRTATCSSIQKAVSTIDG